MFFVVRVDGDSSDTHAAESLAAAVELAMADSDSTVEFGTVTASDAGAARLLRPAAWQRVCADCSKPMRLIFTNVYECDPCGYTVVG